MKKNALTQNNIENETKKETLTCANIVHLIFLWSKYKMNNETINDNAIDSNLLGQNPTNSSINNHKAEHVNFMKYDVYFKLNVFYFFQFTFHKYAQSQIKQKKAVNFKKAKKKKLVAHFYFSVRNLCIAQHG